MAYPQLTEQYRSQSVTEAFRGLNHNLRIADGENYEETNMSSNYYPVMAPRGKRGIYARPESPQGLIAKDALCYVDGSRFVINGMQVELNLSTLPSMCPKQLVSMGAYVIIMPDKVYINTADLSDHGQIEAHVEITGDIRLSMCQLDGEAQTVDYEGPVPPTDPMDGQLWLDTGASPNAIKTWSSTENAWVSMASSYIKIEAPGIGRPFSEMDGVQIHGLKDREDEELKEIDGSFVIRGRADDYIVIVGMLTEVKDITGSITVERKMPLMDFVIESNNRLWGCRYGLNRAGAVVNEIYASKLGDFRNWEVYLGTSTDSYTVSVGTDGRFTGAINYLGYPMFWKADCVHKIYGQMPSQYQVQTTMCRGVEVGSERSLAMVNEVLFYKGRTGICAFDGSLPKEISGQLGEEKYTEGVAGAHGNKYYVSLKDTDGERSLFVYDFSKGQWHREDSVDPLCWCSARNELYYIDNKDKTIKTVLGSGEPAESTVAWEAITGEIGLSRQTATTTGAMPETKYLAQLILRMKMEPKAECSIDIQYDSGGLWEPVASLRCGPLKSFALPIRPKRCDHLRLRLRGKGMVWIYSYAKVIEGGSETRGHEGEVLDF